MLQDGRHVPGQRSRFAGRLAGRFPGPTVAPGLSQIGQEAVRRLLPVATREQLVTEQEPVCRHGVGNLPEEPRLAHAAVAPERDKVEFRGQTGGPELRHLRLAPVEAPPPVHRSCSIAG